MNVVKFEWCAFILPDDMDKWRARYAADIIVLDAESGTVWVAGPNDTEWREVPEGIEILRGKK